MILEAAILNVTPDQQQSFEDAFQQAQKIISGMPGYISHQLQRCLDTSNRYLLLVQWQRVEDHTEGFRKSVQYQQWKKLLHHFYQPFPDVEHFELIGSCSSGQLLEARK